MLKPIRLLSASVLAFATVLSACGEDDGGTEPPPPTLAAPTGVAVTATSAFTARVTWTAATGATSYVVQRATGATGGTFETVGTASTTTFDDSGLNPESQYRYRVAVRRRDDHERLQRRGIGHDADRAGADRGSDRGHHRQHALDRRQGLHPQGLHPCGQRGHPDHPARHEDRRATSTPWGRRSSSSGARGSTPRARRPSRSCSPRRGPRASARAVTGAA